MSNSWVSLTLAQATPTSGGGAAKPETPGMFGSMLPMVLIIGVAFYFLILRPQNQEKKKREEMVSALAKGSKVVTAGGIHGVITNVNEKTTVEIEIAKGVRITINRSSIAVVPDAAGAAKAEEKEDKKEEKALEPAKAGARK